MSSPGAIHKHRTIWIHPATGLERVAMVATVGLLVVAVGLSPLAWGGARPWVLATTQGAILAAAILWLIRLIAARQTELVVTPVSMPVLFGATFVVVRYSLTEPEHPARQEMMLVLSAVLLFFLALHSLRYHEHLGRLVAFWVGLAVLVVFGGLAELATTSVGLGLPHAVGPARWLFAHPADYAGYLGMILPVGVAWCLFSRQSVRARLLLGVGCGIIAVGLIASLAEAAWFGTLTALVVLSFYLVRKRGVRPRWALGGTLLVGLLVLLAARAGQWEAAPDQEPPHGPLWQSALAIGRDQLLLGAGPGMFPWQFVAHRTLPGQPDHPRCEYLATFTEYGLAGLALALWVAVMFGVALVQVVAARAGRYSSSTTSNRYAFAVGVLGTAVGLVVHTAFDGPLHSPANLYTLVVLLGVALTCGVHPTGKVDDDVLLPGRFHTVLIRRSSRGVLIASLAAVVAIFGALWIRTYPAELLRELAGQHAAGLRWTAAAPLYERAWAIDTRNDAVAAAAGDAWLAQATWQRTRQTGAPEEARRWYERAFALNPWRTDLLAKLGRVRELAGENTTAGEFYRRAITADPLNAALHAQLGLYLLRSREPDAAQESFQRALELDPADPLAGVAWRTLGER